MEFLVGGGMISIALAGMTLLWKSAQAVTLLNEVKGTLASAQADQQEMREHLAELRGSLEAMDRRQDKNFHEVGSAWIEMRCRIDRIEERVTGGTQQWRTPLGESNASQPT